VKQSGPPCKPLTFLYSVRLYSVLKSDVSTGVRPDYSDCWRSHIWPPLISCVIHECFQSKFVVVWNTFVAVQFVPSIILLHQGCQRMSVTWVSWKPRKTGLRMRRAMSGTLVELHFNLFSCRSDEMMQKLLGLWPDPEGGCEKCIIIIISNLSNDRSKASSKTIPPHCAI